MFGFYWLDRPRIDPRPGLSREQVPMIQAEILVGHDTAVLETQDDGRLNALIDRFTALAGKSIPPAHPRTKVIGQSSRSELALSCQWFLPPGLDEEESQRLNREQVAYLMTEVWPETPMTFLGGRTPLQAARSGHDRVALRAALLQMQLSGEPWVGLVDWLQFRSRFGLYPEPMIDPETVDIDQVRLARLALVPLSRLDDDRLVKLYLRAREWALSEVAMKAAHEIVDRPGLGARAEIETFSLYGSLAMEAVSSHDRAGALAWIRRGRAAEPADRRAASAPHWDMLEVQVKAYCGDKLDDWVPELAAVLNRYQGNEQATTYISATLMDMGLIRVATSPDRPDEVQLDPRPLQRLMELYGPKVTTSSGYLGVSATRGEIWTPGSEVQGSGIWTPGSDVGRAAGGEKPRIILPGQ
jgi:hypothetical protein